MSRLLLSLALAFTALAVSAQEAPALLDAVGRSPGLEAARRRVEAARARLDSAGRLRDPELEAMALRANMVEENRNMWELTLRQPLPRRGEREADRERARAVVTMAEADYAVMAGEVAAEVALALAEAEASDARTRLIEAQLERLGAVLQSIEARLSTGAGRIADRLTVLSRIAATQLILEKERRMAADARAAARARIGGAPEAALPAFAAPAPAEIVADRAAILHLTAARSAEASAMTRVARAAANPVTSVGLRLEREQTRRGNEDTIGLAFMSEIPWRSRSYARADARAAEAERAAAQAEGDAARHRLANALGRTERATRVAQTARRLANETRARLHAEHDAATRAAAVGVGSGMAGDTAVLHAVDILDKETEAELQVVEAEAAARLAQAELWRYAPAGLLVGSLYSSNSSSSK